jgi:hypothetical protein
MPKPVKNFKIKISNRFFPIFSIFLVLEETRLPRTLEGFYLFFSPQGEDIIYLQAGDYIEVRLSNCIYVGPLACRQIIRVIFPPHLLVPACSRSI